MSNLVYLNGDWLDAKDAKVSVFDRGFLFGDAVYEVIVVYNRQPFRLEQHLSRLDSSLAEVGIQNPYGRHEWINLIQQVIAKSPSEHQSIYIQVSRGEESGRFYHYIEDLVPTVFIYSKAIQLIQEPSDIKAIDAILLEDIRWQRGDIKSTSLLATVLLKKRVSQAKVDEGILFQSHKGDLIVTEGTSSNVFAVLNGVVYTPALSEGLLPGVTRGFVIELAKILGIEVRETCLTLKQLNAADEIWCSSSTAELRPLKALDGKRLPGNSEETLWFRVNGAYQKSKHKLFIGNA